MAEKVAQNKYIEKTMEEVMHESMMPYSEYVILDRALPRVEDGLKPVQRRILYTMHELGLQPDKPYRKSARIVGDCLGKFHPHGDRSVYDAMVRLAQPFSMGATLVNGHGNFGSIDGDSAAAMRYTEAKMTPLALELLRDLDKNTVKWSCNFDDTMIEPDVLPGRFPNLLVNGASGIAVGLATNIPTHNLAEVIKGVVAYIDNSRITLEEMMKHIPCPDFPSGGYIIANELLKAYETGKGRITLRAKIHIENGENDKKVIVIDELPFQVNKAVLLENILKLREEKKGVLIGISDIFDESDRNGMRAVIKVKKDCDPNPIIEVLLKSTALSQTFGINMVAIADGKPQQMGLLDIISYYVDYQREIIYKRSKFELEEAKEREHILQGLVIAVRNIDEVIAIIKRSESTAIARDALRKRFELSERQAQAILDLRLARLTSLEIFKLEQELAEISKLVDRLTAIVNSKKEQMAIVRAELEIIRKNYQEPRKSVLLKSVDEYVIERDDIPKKVDNYVVALHSDGFIKRLTLKSFGSLNKEFTSTSTSKELCNILVQGNTNDRIFCFTNLGNCYKVDVSVIPDAKWRDAGSPLKSIIPFILPKEVVIFAANIGETMPSGNLLFYTKSGMIKKTLWSDYNVVKSFFQTIKLKDSDEVVAIETEIPGNTLAFVTKNGMSLNCDMSDVPSQGRISGGVKGIQLGEDDYVVCARQVSADGEVAVITNKGYAKRVLVAQMDVMARYRKGVKIIDFGKKDNGNSVQFAAYVTEPFDIILCDTDDYMFKFNSEDLSIENRIHAGKPLIKQKKDIKFIRPYVDKLI